MKRTVWIFAAVALAAANACAQPPSATAPSQADILAAESLRQSAQALIHSPPGAIGRAVRLVALTRMAETLAPGNPQTALLLEFIYSSQTKNQLAADAAKAYLASFPDDFAQSIQWLHLGLQAQGESAEKRLAFLRDSAADAGFSNAFKAEAMTLAAQIRQGQGEKNRSAEELEGALKLDPQCLSALRARFALQTSPTSPQRADFLVTLLLANPGDEDSAWQLAQVMGNAGDGPKSVELFNYAWEFVSRRADRQTQAAFAVQHLNAMLDSGQADKAIARFQPLATKFSDNMDLRALLAEAYTLCGQTKSAQEELREMTAVYQRREALSVIPPALACELAWFYSITVARPESALVYARQALAASPDSPLVQRVVAAAELMSSKKDLTDAAIERLKKLADTDMFAAVLLAEQYFQSPDTRGQAQKLLLAAVSLGRSGPAYRRLLSLAYRQGVTIPPPEVADLEKVLARFDDAHRQLALSPDKALEVKIEPLEARVAVAAPIRIRATLTNRSSLPILLGEGGLCSPVLGLQVSIAEYPKNLFDDLPLVIWPAPRALGPSQSVQCEARVDAAALEEFLLQHPLEDLTIKIGAILSPVVRGATSQSWLGDFHVAPASLVRESLLGAFDRATPAEWPKAYRLALGYVVRDMKKGDIAQQMQSARQVGSLLTLARRVEQAKADVPSQLSGEVTVPVLLTMMLEELKSPTPAVRAEMLAALKNVRLDTQILELLSPVVGDASPLVRFRLVEMIGSSGTPGAQTLVQAFANDADELVRLMVSAFKNLPKEK